MTTLAVGQVWDCGSVGRRIEILYFVGPDVRVKNQRTNKERNLWARRFAQYTIVESASTPRVQLLDPTLTGRIEQWKTGYDLDNPYQPPKVRGIFVAGLVYGHKGQPDGQDITTSRIVAVAGKIVTTRSGSRYLLGEPEAAFLAWLKEQGRTFDPENPITMKGTP